MKLLTSAFSFAVAACAGVLTVMHLEAEHYGSALFAGASTGTLTALGFYWLLRAALADTLESEFVDADREQQKLDDQWGQA